MRIREQSDGDARALYHDGVLSHVNEGAAQRGARPGMTLKEFVEMPKR